MVNIEKPSLIINEEIARRNIERMAGKARKYQMAFRPHFKTHHSADVGNWYRDYGVSTITASSVEMAQYFAQNGWSDITIAFPYNPHQWSEINELAAKTRLGILLESDEALRHAGKHISNKISYYIKIDVGYQRTGIASNDIEKITSLMQPPHSTFDFNGFIIHAGHTYGCRSADAVKSLHNDILEQYRMMKSHLGEDIFISHGDTPTCSVCDDFENIDEIRCGNFVYYDLMQKQIGSCSLEDIAVVVAVPVVATHYERNEILIYGGAVHFSKDSLDANGSKTFGRVVRFSDSGWEITEGLYLKKMSQEHGTIGGPEHEIRKLHFGDVIGVLPVHSCLTADLLSSQFTLDGKAIRKMLR